jgi:acyl transferase domain-containing protein/NAD(P)H-dependent flavin oxidoreductase YrpB (nitropropane dioxygenase family)/NADP-dependent 3-hydroxy acid dehydrogenase YdfG
MVEPFGRRVVVGMTPFAEPNARLAAAVERAGGLGVLDLGRDRSRALAALADTARWVPRSFGVRVGPGCPLTPADLPLSVDTIVLASGAPWTVASTVVSTVASGPDRLVLVEVCSADEAGAALAAGAGGLIARGAEAGGRVGDLTTFVLLQTLLAALPEDVPVWAAGGIGLHTAAAAVAGGACGVVLDSQLALTREADLGRETAAAIGAMDGSETVVVGGHRVFTRPDLDLDVDGTGLDGDLSAGDVALRLGSDLRSNLVPVGQDGALARSLADRFMTAGGIVQAVRDSIRDHLTAAASGNGGAGLRHPVVQGPMTRVSDRADFALAVAEGGGLPFLALALMSGDDVRRLLTETAELLGDLPWGVGILGFTPPEVREAQLAVVHEVRPPFALIAGGRPSQAAPLEAAGIATYLHVPSPGLLDRFLREGARRFVFEGFECGGHVGPRASFPLWDTQIERLLAFGADHAGALADLHVLFAGGIGDERSAAMVAAAAAPLSAAGASVGVLMGTAYLFTEEAVAAGAILPGFQRQAVECRGTVLLETSPGHATRCAPTAYVEAFDDARRRLTEAGASQQEMWAELETLNLGRLRIAAKGLRREGGRLALVEEPDQERDGMYMIGQVGALRRDVTTIAALHAQVTSGAADFLADRAAALGLGGGPVEVAAGEEARPLDIAIVGMACIYPDAPDVGRFWSNVVAGVDSVTEVPASRWDADLYYDRDSFKDPQGRTPSKWGGFIPAVPFDALAYGIPPSSLVGIEPVQLLCLEVAARALADSGYGGGRPFPRHRTSVIFGAEAGTDLASAYNLRSAFPAYYGELPAALDDHLPKLTEDSFPGVLGNVIAGRIANRLDLGGVNYTVDAACAASLAALDIACKELRTGTSDMVLCGAGDLHNGIHDYLMFASVHALSPTGRCATFDGEADGIALGEGVACVVLKRLEDAERDGDRVYAVIKAVAGSSDGKSLGLTAPRREGQRAALDRAYRMAGVSPAQVGMVEAHGTGTVVGDRTELAALTEVFVAAGATPGSAVIGSVKSQVGHTKCAAGLAGLVKTALSLHTGVRPGTLHLQEPNPYWDAASSPFFFSNGARPWAAAPAERFAGVSAFGFGGTNFHAVLAGYDGAPEPAQGLEAWPAELFLFRGPDDVDRLADLTAANDRAGRPWALRDLALTLAAQATRLAGGSPVVAAVVADDLDDLAAKVDCVRSGVAADGVFLRGADASADAGQVAFLFPGQGSQRPGMLADLFVAFPRLQQLLRLAGGRYAPVMFPPLAFTSEDKAAQRAASTDTRSAQPTLGIAGLAMHRVLTSVGVHPDLAAGHSYGELVALAAAGAIADDELVRLSAARAAAVLDAAGDDPGGMAAVAASADAVRRALAGDDLDAPVDVVVANLNSPTQTVISGTEPGLDRALARLAAAGLTSKRIPVACAFHSPVVAGASETFGAVLDAAEVGEPSFPVWSNTTAAPHQGDLRAALARHLAHPVRFVDEIEAMYEAGARVFVECGPGGVLTKLVGAILGDRPHAAVACDAPGDHGLRRLLRALAELAVAGVPVDVAPLIEGRARVVVAADVPARPGWLVDGHLVRRADGQPLVGGLLPAQRMPRDTLAGAGTATVAPERDATVLQFLQSTRDLVAAQRDVMLAYLGSPLPIEVSVTDRLVAQVSDVPSMAAVAAAAPVPAPAPAAIDLSAVVLDIISARTGYPRDMLDPDLDLEADLSIGSIKRTEMIGELADRLGLGAAGAALDESVIEDLARIKTIAGIVAWLETHLDLGPTPDPTEPVTLFPARGGSNVTSSTGDPAPGELVTDSGVLATGSVTSSPDSAMRRYVVEVDRIDHPAPAPLSFAGRRFMVVDDGRGISLELADLLEQRGASVLSTDDIDAIGAGFVGGDEEVVHLAALRPGAVPVLPAAFAGIRRALVAGAPTLLLATGSAGTFGHGWSGEESTDPTVGAGIRGLARTIAREFPDVLVRAVDVDTKEAPAKVARHLLDELAVRQAPPVVGYTNGTRSTLTVVETPAAPAPGATPAALDLGPDAVVLLTGGARGITARAAVAIAAASGCHVELVGRTPPPSGAESQATAHADDEIGLRHAIIESGVRKPAEVEAAVRRILAEREVRATLDALAGHAASVRYHVADVRDPAALRAVVDDVYLRRDRIDGVVHGAGVCEDGLLAAKTSESFARVFETKVAGATALAEALRPATLQPGGLRFLALFGSVSGVYGNRGQADYAAANDALDTLARVWRHRLGGARVVSVDWGPWSAAGGGMVTASLEAEYARRGLTTIDPHEGVAALLAELASGPDGPAQVMYTTVLGLEGADA